MGDRNRTVERPDYGLILTATITVAIVTRLAVVTRGDMSLALFLLQTSGPLQVAVSTVWSVLPALFLVAGLMMHRFRHSSLNSTLQSLMDIGSYLLLAAGILLIPLVLGIIVVTVLILLVFLRWQRSRGKPWARSTLSLGRAFFDRDSVKGLAFVILVGTGTLWYPAERIGLVGGQVEVAYVVDVNPDFASTVSVKGLTPEIVPTKSILSREVCAVFPSPDNLMRLLWPGTSEIPNCASGPS